MITTTLFTDKASDFGAWSGVVKSHASLLYHQIAIVSSGVLAAGEYTVRTLAKDTLDAETSVDNGINLNITGVNSAMAFFAGAIEVIHLEVGTAFTAGETISCVLSSSDKQFSRLSDRVSDAHIASTSNPHSVTHAQLSDVSSDQHHAQSHGHDGADGSGTVAYSDLTGIPATFPPAAHSQAWSTITSTPTTLSGYGITDGISAAEKTKIGYISITQAVDLDAIETRVNALDASVILMGTFDASAGSFPGGGTAQAGESWIASVGGTINGIVITANDRVIAITDNASTSVYASNWHLADYTDDVQSVAGKTGAVTLVEADITDLQAYLLAADIDTLAELNAILTDAVLGDAGDFATAVQGTTADAALPRAGGQMSGNITMAGAETVDGRDLSVDGATLDAIPAIFADNRKLALMGF